ncbi:MAG: hypothetical protein IPM06_21405 [Rhizobiales bacterium]|nr:hypothetical protein [Hyphomicrobiales bacterium]MBK8772969.1 hypothetical protein [Hyphomicrobiales bacterium]
MNVIKQEQHKTELNIFQCRNEGGLQAMRDWLYARQARINTEWIGMAGDDLIREQGEARVVARLIKLIDDGPAIKQLQGA